MLDLGQHWEEKMGVPIPLGGIVIKKSLGNDIYERVNQLINQSLQQSFNTYPKVSNYVKEHAQAMSEDVMRQHIELYVNNYSLNLGVDGKKAIDVLQTVFEKSSK